jgi:hypothetical protein
MIKFASITGKMDSLPNATSSTLLSDKLSNMCR